MPSRFRLRRVFGPLVRGIARGFIRLGISPNTISFLGVLLAFVATLLFILFQWVLLYGGLVFLVGVLDGVDGEVARQTGQASPVGGYLDSLLDRLADVMLLLPFLWLPNPLPTLGPSWGWVFAGITGCLLVSYVRSRAQAAGVPDTDVGLAARSERLFILVLASLFVLLHPWAPYLGLILVTVLSHLTVGFRVILYYQQLQRITRPNL